MVRKQLLAVAAAVYLLCCVSVSAEVCPSGFKCSPENPGTVGDITRLEYVGGVSLNLTALNLNGYTSLTDLIVTEGFVTEIPPNFLHPVCGTLKTLNFEENEFLQEDFPVTFFDGCTSLTHLDLSDNNFTSLLDGVLNPLTGLEWLDLSNNFLKKDISGASFPAGLSNLKFLDLRNNLLSFDSLAYDSFSNLAALETLHLDSNKILGLPPGIFNQTTSLANLSLSHNPLLVLEHHVMVPSLGASLTTLDVSHCSLTDVVNDTWEPFSALQVLDLSHNDLEFITYQPFNQMVALRKLDLSHNKITAVKSDFLEGVCTSLEYFDVSHNEISEVGPDLFRGCAALLHANFAENNVEILDKDLFDFCEELQWLSFAHNMIEFLPQGILDPCPLLEYVNFAFNELLQLPNRFLFVQTELRKVDLAQNFINNVTDQTFVNLEKLKVLDLSRNRLTDVPENLLYTLDQLEELYLYDNEIVGPLSSQAFAHAGTLRVLSLSGNNLTMLQDDLLTPLANLTNLRVDGNRIEQIFSESLNTLTELQSLDLSGNKLSNLPVGVFAALEKLEEVFLDGNQIEVVLPHLFSDNPKLRVVNLNGNRLKEVPPLFANNLLMDTIDLDDNELEELPASLLDGLTELLYFHADGNPLRDLPDRFFSGDSTGTGEETLLVNLNDIGMTMMPFPPRYVQVSSGFRGALGGGKGDVGSMTIVWQPPHRWSFPPLNLEAYAADYFRADVFVGDPDATVHVQVDTVASGTSMHLTDLPCEEDVYVIMYSFYGDINDGNRSVAGSATAALKPLPCGPLPGPSGGNGSDDDDGLSGGEVALIVLCCVIGVAIFCYLFYQYRKHQERRAFDRANGVGMAPYASWDNEQGGSINTAGGQGSFVLLQDNEVM